MHKCPTCGGKLERVITPNMAIIFKGSGFYETDYKRKSNGNGNDHKKTEKNNKQRQMEKKTEKKVAETKEASKKE